MHILIAVSALLLFASSPAAADEDRLKEACSGLTPAAGTNSEVLSTETAPLRVTLSIRDTRNQRITTYECRFVDADSDIPELTDFILTGDDGRPLYLPVDDLNQMLRDHYTAKDESGS